jgi:hypothetical protein
MCAAAGKVVIVVKVLQTITSGFFFNNLMNVAIVETHELQPFTLLTINAGEYIR